MNRPAAICALLAISGCVDRAAVLRQRPCPCADGYVCCESIGICREDFVDCPARERIDGVEPTVAPAFTEVELTISGHALDGIAEARLGGRTCAIRDRSSATLTCISVPLRPGRADVELISETGEWFEWSPGVFIEREPFEVSTDFLPRQPGTGYGLSVADLDGDGTLDLAFAIQAATGTQAIFLGAGELSYTPAPSLPDDTVPATHVVPIDLEGDGEVELFIPRPSSDIAAIAGSSGGQRVQLLESGRLYTLTPADFDGDGYTDVVGCRWRAGGTQRPFFFGHNIAAGGGRELIDEPLDLLPTSTPRSCPIADYDRDGDLDVLACGEELNLWVQEEGRLVPSEQPMSIAFAAFRSGRGFCESAHWVDVDGDGDLDVAVTNNIDTGGTWEQGTMLFINQLHEAGRATLEALYLADEDAALATCVDGRDTLPVDASLAGGGSSLAWLDYDHDGDLDLLAPYPSRRCVLSPWIYQNKSTAAGVLFRPRVLFTAPQLQRVSASVVADLDGDGDLDVVTHQLDGGTGRALFRNMFAENGTRRGRYLSVRARYGATVELDLDGPGGEPDFALGSGRIQVRALTGEGGNALGPPVAHFGLGDRVLPLWIRARDASGERRVEVRDFDRTIDLR